MCLAFPLHGAERAEPSSLVVARIRRSGRDYDAKLAQHLCFFLFFFFLRASSVSWLRLIRSRGKHYIYRLGIDRLNLMATVSEGESLCLIITFCFFWFFWVLHLWQRLWRVKSPLISRKAPEQRRVGILLGALSPVQERGQFLGICKREPSESSTQHCDLQHFNVNTLLLFFFFNA